MYMAEPFSLCRNSNKDARDSNFINRFHHKIIHKNNKLEKLKSDVKRRNKNLFVEACGKEKWNRETENIQNFRRAKLTIGILQIVDSHGGSAFSNLTWKKLRLLVNNILNLKFHYTSQDHRPLHLSKKIKK